MTNDRHKNIGWIDTLRVTACFMVVLAHCCDPFVAQFNANPQAFLTGVFTGSLMRPCVPLFVMMTAVLLLPIEKGTTIDRFYTKRIGRLIKPLVFWSMALPLMTYAYFNYIGNNTANAQLSVADYTPETLLSRLYTFVFNFNFDTTPLWYLYMLAGIYIIMPILNSWLVQATQKEIRTILYIWGITLFLPYIKMLAPTMGFAGNYGNMGLLGECDWNIYGTFYYMSGFIGYIILTYYLKTYPLQWSNRKMAAICIPMFVVGYIITSVGFVVTNSYFPGNYAYLEILWYFTGINVFMMTFPIFVAAQRINGTPHPVLSNIAKLTFGVYLCHFAFTFVSYDIYDIPALPYIVRIILAAITTFAVSIALVWVMSRFRQTRILIN